MKNWDGNSKSIFSPIGASSHSGNKRAAQDYYATNPGTIDDLFAAESFADEIWEPACGEGHLSERMKKYRKSVYSTDLIDRGYGDAFFDFLGFENPTHTWCGDIITNPPYKFAKEFVEKSLDVVRKNNKVAMFLKLTFVESKKRKKMFQKYPPKHVWVYSERQTVAKNGKEEEFKKSSAVCYAWFVWIKGYSGDTILKWIEGEKNENAYD